MPAMTQAPVTFSLSTVANQIKRSVMRDLIALANQPEIVSFAGGLPAADHLPLEAVQTCLEAVLRRDGTRALQYGPAYLPLREWIAGDMQRRGVRCAVENVFITNGAQQALEIVARLLLDHGEPAVVEALTFTGIGQVMDAHGAALRVAAFDEATGVDPQAFEEALTRGRKARLGVVIPDFNNPTGASLTLEKRQRLAAAAARSGVPLVEDDCYGQLRYAGERLPPIKAFDEAEQVLYISSFSKIVSPAMRLGWIVAPAALIGRLTVLRESIDLESSQLLQRVVTEFVTRGFLEPHLAALNSANRERRDALMGALDRTLNGRADWAVPEGGLFLWVRLQDEVETAALLPRAFEHKVAFIPGVNFSAEGRYGNCLRLNYSNNLPERIDLGVGRLAEALAELRAVQRG
jgi:2-aminoadipate transaminase